MVQARRTGTTVNEIPKGIDVGATNGGIYVRVTGRGTFQNSQPLRRYAQEMIERGCHEFVVDLGPCLGMDSTFLGVLAGIGLRLGQTGRTARVQIIRAGARNMELLQTLGLDRLFEISTGASAVAAIEPTLQRLPDSDLAKLNRPLSKHDTADLMLEAHDNLIRADQRNLAKFKDLTQFLRDNVAKRAAANPPPPPPAA
jgi:anti-anti-sigma regulatory factor